MEAGTGAVGFCASLPGCSHMAPCLPAGRRNTSGPEDGEIRFCQVIGSFFWLFFSLIEETSEEELLFPLSFIQVEDISGG